MYFAVTINELLCLKNAVAQISLFFTSHEQSAPMAIEKIKILGERFGATSQTALPIQPIYHKNGPVALKFSWQFQNGAQYLNFFTCHGCQTFILAEIHCYLSPHIFGNINSFLSCVPFDNSFSLLCCFSPHGHLPDPRYLFGQIQTFVIPPTHLILSNDLPYTQTLNDPEKKYVKKI